MNPYNFNELPPEQRAAAAKKVDYIRLREVSENEKAHPTSRMVAKAELARKDRNARSESTWLTRIVVLLTAVAAVASVIALKK